MVTWHLLSWLLKVQLSLEIKCERFIVSSVAALFMIVIYRHIKSSIKKFQFKFVFIVY